MPGLEERLYKREEIFNGKVLHMVKDTVILPNGALSEREICLHGGAVAVIPLTDDLKVIMERQFRYAHGRVFFEIPAGKLDAPDEDHLEAAIRELREETGATAGSITYLGCIDTSPALLSEKIDLYLARELNFGERELDEDEFIDLELVDIRELRNMVMRGEIKDAKTQIAILKACEILRQEGITI
jgi:ADP-ribose pyrophosphatase